MVGGEGHGRIGWVCSEMSLWLSNVIMLCNHMERTNQHCAHAVQTHGDNLSGSAGLRSVEECTP